MKKILLMIGIIFILFLYGCGAEKNSFGPLGSTHKHADVKIYVLGNAIDLSQQKYQLKSNLVHFEDFDGDIAHVHTTGMTLGYMFKTLGMKLDENCLKIDTGKEYCSSENAGLKVYVKSHDLELEKIFSPENYIIRDLDRILVTYGSEIQEEIKKQMESVTKKALEAAEEPGHED